MDGPVTTADVYDWDKMSRMLAAQAPWWKPGTQSGYHAITQGYLIGEVVRRVTGMSLGTFFRKEIAEPIGADFHIGLDPRHFGRVGNLIPPPAGNAPIATGDATSIAARTFRYPPVNALDSRTPEWRRAEIPAGNGHGNARSVAKVQTLIANGGSAFGKRILSKAGCDRVVRRTEQRSRSRARRAGTVRHGLRPHQRSVPARPESAYRVLGRLGRLVGASSTPTRAFAWPTS